MGTRERKQREKEARKEEILDAAEKVFFQRGLSQATMDEVAETAELSKGTLYLYYRSKEDLYLAISLRGFDLLYGLLQRAAIGRGPVVLILVSLVDAYLEFFRRHRQYFQTFYFFENPQLRSLVSEDLLKACEVSDRKIWDLVVSVIQRGISEGMLHKGLEPVEVSVMMWSNVHGFLRLIDRNAEYWKEQVGIDLETTLRKSSIMLLEAMMTETAKKQHPSLLLYHAGNETFRGTSNSSDRQGE